ncbi:MAG: hypothetical protein HN369_03060 [Campylobacteraceae bacterium]|jgi:hypothetical protein|nr:hypothetical protein [Campylobacteraceae bacterium]
MTKKNNQSLQNFLKGKLAKFKEPQTDDNMKEQGLDAIIRKINSFHSDQGQKEVGNNTKILGIIIELFKDNSKFDKKVKVLTSMLETPSDIKKDEAVGSKNKKKIVGESLKKESPSKLPKAKDKKSQLNAKKNAPKSNIQNDKIMKSMFENINIIKKENSQILTKLTNLENKVKNLKDLDYNVSQITKKNQEIQETLVELDSLPAKFKKLTDKFDTLNEVITNLNVGGVKKSKNNVPKDVQAIEELTKYIGDGLKQFDHIAKYYVSQQTQFEKNEKLQANLDSEIIENKELAFKEGENKSKAAIAKEIYTSFPTDFNKFKSIFEDIMSERYKENEKITTTSENLQELETEIKDKLEVDTTYIIKTPATLIDNEILIKATVEESK